MEYFIYVAKIIIKQYKKTVRHYHCPTCNKPLQKLKFLSHLKNCFYIDREEKVNENEDLLSSTLLELSAVADEYFEPRNPKRANKFQNQKHLEKGENFINHLNNNDGDNNNHNNEELISISSLNSIDRGIVFYHSTISTVNVIYTQSCKNCEKTKVIAPTSSSKIITSLKIDENNPGEGNMSLKDTKDITENPSKVKSNFDQITSVDEDEIVFIRVLEKQHMTKFDMEKWKNLRAEGKMNLNDGKVSLPQEWTNHFYEVIKQHSKYCVIIFSKHTVPKKGNILMTGYFHCKFLGCNIKGKIIFQKNGEIETIHEKNVVNYHRGPNASFFSRQIQGSKRESVGRDIIREKYPSKTWH